MKRKIIRIDEELCNGCGQCIPNCPEGALQLIEGKARLISDLFCDGLGACIGECPVGAIRVEEREAEPYDERRVMDNIIAQGEGVIRAHLAHLKAHGEEGYLRQALDVLTERGLLLVCEGEEIAAGLAIETPVTDASAFESPSAGASVSGGRALAAPADHRFSGCPGARVRDFTDRGGADAAPSPAPAPASVAGGGSHAPASELRQWPVQLHLLPPSASYLQDADVLLAADCTAYAHADFHRRFLRSRRLAIACPKLDSHQDIYLDKLEALIDFAGIRSLTVLTMEVPCCRGLLQLARKASAQSKRRIPVHWIEVSVQGDVLQQQALG
jgi:ferredoxin